jgi:hypothetical protein
MIIFYKLILQKNKKRSGQNTEVFCPLAFFFIKNTEILFRFKT